MGFFTLILIAAIAGGFFLFRSTALLGPAESKFVRRDEGGSVLFDVTPARPSMGFLLFRGGLLALLFYLVVLLPSSALDIAPAPGFLVWAAIAYILFRPFLQSQPARRSGRLAVSADTLIAGGRRIPLAAIAQFQVRQGVNMQAAPVARTSYENVDGSVQRVTHGTSLSAALSAAAHNRLAERSFVVTVRTTNGGSETTLSGGLTRACAQALADDLSRTVAFRAA